MKTTIDIADGLFKQARGLADRQGKTFREIVDISLRNYIRGLKSSPESFKLKKHPFKGKGLVAGLSEGDWNEIRRRAYEGRGG